PVRLPAAAEAPAARPPAPRRPADGRDGRTVGPGDPWRTRGRRTAHAAGAGVRPRDGPGSPGGTPPGNYSDASVGAAAEGRSSGPRRPAVRAVRGRIGHAE